jgi:N-acetylmuramoyl-L-alanine amidase
VTVSKGPKLPDISEKTVIVPNLIGLAVADALQALEKEDLKGSYKEEYNDVVEKGIVISQSTQAGSEAKAEDIVFFMVSLGKKDAPTSTISTTSAATGKVICIDPGHQTKANLSTEPIGPGSTTMKEKVRGGATGVSSGTPEHKITLQIGLKLRALLERAGYTVVMTRETNDVDISNAERAKMANQANANLFVRIHCDGSDNSSTNGISTLYPTKNQWTGAIYDRSLRAAQLIQSEVIKATGRKDNGVVARGDMTGFNWSQVPVILVEGGFLSNPEEDRLLNTDEFQQKLAQGMYNGIVKYLQ